MKEQTFLEKGRLTWSDYKIMIEECSLDPDSEEDVGYKPNLAVLAKHSEDTATSNGLF